MRKIFRALVLAFLSALTMSQSLNLYAEPRQRIVSDGPVRVEKIAGSSQQSAVEAKVYRVRMKTRFIVPSSGVRIDQLRIWHALPTKRAWDTTGTQVGGSEISWTPATGQRQYEKSRDSHHIYWDTTELSPGSTLSFETQFTVSSPARTFDPQSTLTAWRDYSATTLPEYDKRQDIHGELAEIADRIRAARMPAEAVLEFCKWVSANIAYDASVSYPSGDVASAMRSRRGHCGHYAEILTQLCNRAGIPIRQVFGLNLYAKDGVTGGLQHIRSDYTNVHAWAEVYFPNVGWVEVEPSGKDQAFAIPARYIQNNKWFENCAIWISQNGQWKQPEWRDQGGSYVSPYGVETIISYAEQ